MTKCLVVLSGGQDSTTCLFYAIKHFGVENVRAINFNYGQRHMIECGAAKIVAGLAGIAERHYERIEIGPLLKGTSPLINEAAPLEQYADHQSLPGGLEKTFVPARNQLFLTIAANRAYIWDCDVIVVGVSKDDAEGYPDCRQPFIHAMEASISRGLDRNMRISTPLIHIGKAETVRLALTLPGCYFALAYSHTAYDGAYPPVGKDHATLLRAKGFEEADIPDPLIMRAALAGLMQLPLSQNYSQFLREFVALPRSPADFQQALYDFCELLHKEQGYNHAG